MLSFCRKDRVDRRHQAISGLSMILNDTIKRGRNSHFIWTRKHTEMMTSQRLDTPPQWREPAGEPKINADSQRVPLLGGRDVPAYCRWGSPPAAGCGLVWVGSFQMTWIKYLMGQAGADRSKDKFNVKVSKTYLTTPTYEPSMVTFTDNDHFHIIRLDICLTTSFL